jgi:hypothetical protein
MHVEDQGDLYLRDDQGGVFVAVAAPLNMDDDIRYFGVFEPYIILKR